MLHTITNEQISALIDRYHGYDGMVYTIEGTLNDNYILNAEGKKTVIIKELPLNEWSSCCVIRRYNKCPKKYEKVMDLLLMGQNEKAEKLFFS